MASNPILDIEALKRLIDDRIEAQLGSRKANGHAYSQRLLSIEDAATYLGRTEAGVRALISSGKLPKVQVDRRVMCDRKDLDQFIEKGKLG